LSAESSSKDPSTFEQAISYGIHFWMPIISRADYILLAAPLITKTLHMIVSDDIGMEKLGEVPF
jgi:hypothetical protein